MSLHASRCEKMVLDFAQQIHLRTQGTSTLGWIQASVPGASNEKVGGMVATMDLYIQNEQSKEALQSYVMGRVKAAFQNELAMLEAPPNGVSDDEFWGLLHDTAKTKSAQSTGFGVRILNHLGSMLLFIPKCIGGVWYLLRRLQVDYTTARVKPESPGFEDRGFGGHGFGGQVLP